MPIRIALADDHQLVRGGIRLLIDQFKDCKVVAEAMNGADLIDQLNAMSVLPDLAFVDVGMPVMDGYLTTERINEQFPSIRVIGLSVHDDMAVVRKMIDSGAHAYLLKDSSPDSVHETIIQVFNKGYYYSQFVIDSIMSENIQSDKNAVASKKSAEQQRLINSLTPRETDFILQCCSEKTYKEIADVMAVSQRTVDGYRESVFSKLNLRSRTGIVLFAIYNRLLTV